MRKSKWIFGLLGAVGTAIGVGCITDPGAILGLSADKQLETAAYWNRGGRGTEDAPGIGNDNAGAANENENGETENGNDNAGTENGNDNGETENGNDNGDSGATGACCQPDGTCEITTEAACSSSGLTADMNCDGFVSIGDISGFVLALSDPAAFEALFPNCRIFQADCNNDSVVTVGDIGPFVSLLTSAPTQGSSGTGTWLGAGTTCADCTGNGNGNDNGTANGNDNAPPANGNDNAPPTNGNDNAPPANGNDNAPPANGNDNAPPTNGNDNGVANGNDNAPPTNGNDNGAAATCPDGSDRLRIDPMPFESRARWHRSASCRWFNVRTQAWPQSNVTVDVTVNGTVVGQMSIDDRGRGELTYDSSFGTMPVGFVDLQPGDVVSIGTQSSGALLVDCSMLSACGS